MRVGSFISVEGRERTTRIACHPYKTHLPFRYGHESHPILFMMNNNAQLNESHDYPDPIRIQHGNRRGHVSAKFPLYMPSAVMDFFLPFRVYIAGFAIIFLPLTMWHTTPTWKSFINVEIAVFLPATCAFIYVPLQVN